MNKLYLTLLIASYVFCGNAQILQIEDKSGGLLELEVNNIKEMRFKKTHDYEGTTPTNLEIVDMGLSVNWASLNVGASDPENVGGYVSWGGVTLQTWYSWSVYPYGTSQSSLTKYTKSDGLTTLQPEDDYATVSWGSEWRTPTIQEFAELLENSTIDYDAVLNGIKGVKLTSTVPGYENASLFFPSTGWIQDNYRLSEDDVCSYWTSGVHSLFPAFAVATEFWLSGDYANTVQQSGTYRYLGHPVRAVTAKKL